IVGTIFAAVRGRRIEAAALVAGWLLVYAGVHLAKAAYDRPRPSGSLVETTLSSYPSGHAAYAIAWIAGATVLGRAGAGWGTPIAAVTVATALVALVAVTRVYLGAHYLTDVLGGLGLGVAIWSLVGGLSLFRGRVRHNVPG